MDMEHSLAGALIAVQDQPVALIGKAFISSNFFCCQHHFTDDCCVSCREIIGGRDMLARYYSPRWYLNQFHCSIGFGLCSPEADELVEEALEARDFVAKSTIYAEAQRALIAEQAFIPLGQPVRWSLVRAGVTGFEENQWGLHALFPLATSTI